MLSLASLKSVMVQQQELQTNPASPSYTHAARAALLVLHGLIDHEEGEVRGGVWQYRTQQLLVPDHAGVGTKRVNVYDCSKIRILYDMKVFSQSNFTDIQELYIEG